MIKRYAALIFLISNSCWANQTPSMANPFLMLAIDPNLKITTSLKKDLTISSFHYINTPSKQFELQVLRPKQEKKLSNMLFDETGKLSPNALLEVESKGVVWQFLPFLNKKMSDEKSNQPQKSNLITLLSINFF